jgi:hypothetical protein
MILLPDPALYTSGLPSRRDRVATAARTAPGTRQRTGTSPATSTVSTANTGRTTGHSPQLPIRTSTAGAGMQARSPVAGCPASNSDHQPDPGEAESTAAFAADFAAASGTGGRPRGALVRGIKKRPRSGSTHQDDRMQVNLSEHFFYLYRSLLFFSLKDV